MTDLLLFKLLKGTLNLGNTYVPLPFAYDAMKNTYIKRNETRCAMMVTVDYLNQCPDSNRSNNFAAFPVKLVVNEEKGMFNCKQHT